MESTEWLADAKRSAVDSAIFAWLIPFLSAVVLLGRLLALGGMVGYSAMVAAWAGGAVGAEAGGRGDERLVESEGLEHCVVARDGLLPSTLIS